MTADVHEIDGLAGCTVPERDERGMWRAVYVPSGRVIESFAWERLVFKALRARLDHAKRRTAEGQ